MVSAEVNELCHRATYRNQDEFHFCILWWIVHITCSTAPYFEGCWRFYLRAHHIATPSLTLIKFFFALHCFCWLYRHVCISRDADAIFGHLLIILLICARDCLPPRFTLVALIISVQRVSLVEYIGHLQLSCGWPCHNWVLHSCCSGDFILAMLHQSSSFSFSSLPRISQLRSRYFVPVLFDDTFSPLVLTRPRTTRFAS